LTTAIEKITPVEAKIAGCKVDPISALDDVINFIDSEMGPVDTTVANKELRLKLQAFDQFFAPTGQRTNFQGWSSRALRIRFVAQLAQQRLKDMLKPRDCEKFLERANRFDSKLNAAKGNDVETMRNDLLPFQKKRLAYFSELRGKSLTRVFWQVLSPDNLDQIESI
jgi:hypothetical protein